MTTPPVALTIAGSDSGGCAGVQADLKTFAAMAVFGTSAITALTAQNTVGVHGVHPVPADFVNAQIDAVVSDLQPAATKTGMLGTAEIVGTVADAVMAHGIPNLVVDPVMVATSGDRLLDVAAESAYLDRLFPLAAVVTPNTMEAAALVGAPIETVEAMRSAARALGEHCGGVVVVKGGHLVDVPDGRPDAAVDVVWDGRECFELRGPRVDTDHTHGTGCSFAAAVTAALARGAAVVDAVRAAKSYVHAGLIGGARWRLGVGSGPIDHFAGSSPQGSVDLAAADLESRAL